ncbi:13426_t:CDS:1 [Acaulospora morrowiae]|uniref:13426_t:CDS:1 n=1 Tax=Acaulospora morrowiae TaxID=94023 RepID=A0A9N9B9K4_9GLOM|nr:13426_t:CDS:1 [Acaulospora morrowiae]
MDTTEQRNQERENISTFVDLFVFTLIPLIIFKGKSHFNQIKFVTELTFYIFGYDSILIINREKSQSIALLIVCVVIPSILHVLYMTFVWIDFSRCKKHYENRKIMHPAIRENGSISVEGMYDTWIMHAQIFGTVLVLMAMLVVPIISGYFMYYHHVFETVDFFVMHTLASSILVVLFLYYLFYHDNISDMMLIYYLVFSLSHLTMLIVSDTLYLKTSIGCLILYAMRGINYNEEFRETLLKSKYETIELSILEWLIVLLLTILMLPFIIILSPIFVIFFCAICNSLTMGAV